MASWTAFLPEATKWVSERYSPLHGQPHRKARKHRKIRLHRAHIHNALVAHGVHPAAMRGRTVSIRPARFRRSQAYSQK